MWSETDPIHAVIEGHQAAWDAFQIASDGEASLAAEAALDAALDMLLGTACTTWSGAAALLGHLRWWLAEEAGFADSYQPSYGFAQARASDLALLLGPLPPAEAALPLSLGSIAAGIVGHLVPRDRFKRAAQLNRS